MAKRKTVKKTAVRGGKAHSPKKYVTYRGTESSDDLTGAKEERVAYGSSMPISNVRSFKVTRGGNQKDYSVRIGYGYFIPSLRKAENMVQVADLVEKGIPSKEIQSIIEYLEFKVPEIAKAAAVSPSTVSRWEPETSIGVSGSSQFFRIDEIIKKGVDLFGGLAEFKSWLHSPNIALGNVVPAKLITSLIGVELVDEALDALHYGNVM